MRVYNIRDPLYYRSLVLCHIYHPSISTVPFVSFSLPLFCNFQVRPNRYKEKTGYKSWLDDFHFLFPTFLFFCIYCIYCIMCLTFWSGALGIRTTLLLPSCTSAATAVALHIISSVLNVMPIEFEKRLMPTLEDIYRSCRLYN